MKKILAAILIALLVIAALVGCNYNPVDLKYNFRYAQIMMPDGNVISGEVKNWTDYENGDEVQITIGTVTYLTHYENVARHDAGEKHFGWKRSARE